MKAMETLQDLIEEAKLRTVWWSLCIFAFAYFLSHTSKSLWMNIPIAILLVSALRILANEIDFRWKHRPETRPKTYLTYLERKQLSLNDPRLFTAPPTPKWKRKVDSPLVEDAINEFVRKIMKDFVVDLWYTDITPDKEAPELIGAVITDAIGEICGRLKQLNLVDLLTRDVVDLVGDHIDLFRRNQAVIGVDVMGTLSIEERDERLKHHLMASKELHPALISPECEYKVLQRLIGGVLAVVLRPREAQCPLVRCIARELVTCLVMQPVMNFASPAYINELIECILLAVKDNSTTNVGGKQSNAANDLSIISGVQGGESTARKYASPKKTGTDMTLTKMDTQREILSSGVLHENPMQSRQADWVRAMEAATQRRTEVLAPENLESMWNKGRDYKKKGHKKAKVVFQEPTAKSIKSKNPVPAKDLTKEMISNRPGSFAGNEDKALVELKPGLSPKTQTRDPSYNGEFSQEVEKGPMIESVLFDGESDDANSHEYSLNKNRLKRSNSTSALNVEPFTKKVFTIEGEVSVLSEDFYSANVGRHNDEYIVKSSADVMYRNEGLLPAKLRCRVIGAYFEKVGSKSFAVYSIAVTDVENTTWFVKRRYRNFERLHRQLKDIPNYTLHLPPKRIFSSSTEDAFVHQRCIQLDRYLQDLLSIANVAEQHEVWDFLSVSSKNYSFGKSSSVMRTLAVNVDDAMDDIVRQFKGVSDGLLRIVASPSLPNEAVVPFISDRNMSWHADEMRKQISLTSTAESINSFSDNEEGEQDGTYGHGEIEPFAKAVGWHSDNEFKTKAFPPWMIKRDEDFKSSVSDRKLGAEVKFDWMDPKNHAASFSGTSGGVEDPIGMPPEWTPPNVSVPILNLVDKIFQLKRRGWLRRQVFWISKQILQLMMEDAIDDWLLRQIHWLRREDVIAEGIKWVQDVLWPDGVFFLPLSTTQSDVNDTEHDQKPNGTASQSGSKASKAVSFEQQLEAARRASDIKKMLFDGAPATLVSLIGSKQYKRCAKDIYYFSQSTICVKQLGYGVLELALISVFPELRDLVIDMHKQMRGRAI